jgi:hypothetical protein
MQITPLEELASTKGVRVRETCPTDVAKAIQRYLSIDQHEVRKLREIALDRALSATCVR